MKYRKLELLLMSVGLLGILISMLTSMAHGARTTELLGQALFVPILVFALHYGRQFGYAAAVGAAVIYLIARTQESGGLDMATLNGRFVIAQAVAFGLVGILGGELATRIKYVVARIADEEFIDKKTKLFSPRYMQSLLAKLLSAYERRERPFAVIFIEPTWARPTPENDRTRQVGRMANVIRGTVRLVDEVGYLSDGRFCLILPDTGGPGAEVVLQRLGKAYSSARQYWRFSAEWETSILTMPEDASEIGKLAPVDTMMVIA